MSAWLIFFSLFVKPFTQSIPQPFAVLPFFVIVLYLAFQVSLDPQGILKAKVFQGKVILYFALLTLSEIVLLIWNYSKFGSDSQDFNILGSFVGFISTIISFLLVYFLLYFSIKSDFDMQRFIRGSMLTLFLMGVFILLPQLTVAAGKNIFLGWANLLDRSILPRWEIPSDYLRGSYVATLHRANGLEIEPAFLAGQLSVVFLPWILSAIKHNFSFLKNKFGNFPYEAYLLLAFIVITLVLAKTTTGLVAIILTALIMVSDLRGPIQKFFIGAAVLALFLLGIAYFTLPRINGFLNNYLFAKGGFSASDRIGGTIGLFLTFLHYPLIGVGNGYIGHYLVEYVPRNTKLNIEYLWGFRHRYSVLSDWGGFFAQYGLLFFLPIVKKVRELFYNFRTQIVQDDLTFFVKDAAKYTMIIYSFLALFDFNWLSYYSLISIFVFVRFVQYRMDEKLVVKS
ncbi:hypothetical protein R5P91_09200 [Oenococcus oeni]